VVEEPVQIAAPLKRGVDILAASAGLIIFLPLMIVLALVVLATEGHPLLYREQRLGRYGRLFSLYKFRTLKPDSAGECSVAPEDDLRITGAGLWLRRWRLDEFPQLFNVLCGHMSLVGPRPMPPSHGATLPTEQLDVLLSVRPGITDAAAIYFLAEDAMLAGRDDAEALYLQCLLPVKVRMQIDSLRCWSLTGDLRIAMRTLALLWSRQAREESAIAMREILETADAVPPARSV
jgi:lipopolysaccharide/colanic/teichoic acid biosynthesis glycosyltransferase